MKVRFQNRTGSSRPPVARQSGVALVVTLILLSVITFMAIAFLVLSHREQSSVTATTDEAIARQAADSAMERGLAEMIVGLVNTTNAYNVGLHVSTNYINPAGFYPNVLNPTNVNYDSVYGNPATRLNALQMEQNIANLLYSPRPPVFIVTNRLLGSNDFRYFIDLNRNGVFEPTGLVPEYFNGQLTGNAMPVTGDPQWVGILQYPDEPHSADNRFVSRYAFEVIPADETLDVNYIHNQAKLLGPNVDGFCRNQGVGTWEDNLAAFLIDLNTNIYAPPILNSTVNRFNPLVTQSSGGPAYEDALQILLSRYNTNYLTLASVYSLFGDAGRTNFLADWVNAYSQGPIMSGTRQIAESDNPQSPWPGADNLNHYYTPQDLFNPAMVHTIRSYPLSFAERMAAASSLTNNTYNQYTYYRLLSQLGTDSAPEPADKMNLNYDNLARTNLNGIASATNFMAWDPATFFTNAANRLLKDAGYSFSITNIQVWPINYYTPSVHRLLQLAANICESTTTNRAFNCPTVFRPIFRYSVNGTNREILIAGYREIYPTQHGQFVNGLVRLVDLDILTNSFPGPFPTNAPGAPVTLERNEPMVWGMPLIIAAKKGFPNFNEFSAETKIDVLRLLEFRRNEGLPADDPANKVIQTNQMYVASITNSYGIEGWNSYLAAYTNDVQVAGSVQMTATITNEFGSLLLTSSIPRGFSTNIPAGRWPGWATVATAASSFVLPLGTNQAPFLASATYRSQGQPPFVPFTHIFERGRGFPIPHWTLNMNTKVLFAVYDTRAQRLIDYVTLNKSEDPVDIMSKLQEGADCSTITPQGFQNMANLWCTNRLRNSISFDSPTYGIINQIMVALNGTDNDWRSFSYDPYSGNNVHHSVDFFRYNLGLSPIFNTGLPVYKTNVFYAPFSPYRPIYVHNSLQANDPLVHYTVGDLVDLSTAVSNKVDFAPQGITDIGQINARYEPWGGNPRGARSNPVIGVRDIAAKDPLVTRPDDWDFPTNKFPNVGWLGRVHRGTPWQTVFLKSTNVLAESANPVQGLRNWQQWTGNAYLYSNNPVRLSNYPPNAIITDAVVSLPTNDWRVLDLFTAALNDNATRGRLSVNQTNLAAWSAVLSGVNVLSDANNSTFIEPAGVYTAANPTPLARIVAGINRTRTTFPGGSFQHLGDVLATPELTIASPYFSTNVNAVINDAVVERIPQQIMGLLKGGEPPRFVIYSWGQTLKPAAKGVVPNGTFFGLVTNYTITAEVATKAVVRIDGAPTNPHAVVESYNVLPPE